MSKWTEHNVGQHGSDLKAISTVVWHSWHTFVISLPIVEGYKGDRLAHSIHHNTPYIIHGISVYGISRIYSVLINFMQRILRKLTLSKDFLILRLLISLTWQTKWLLNVHFMFLPPQKRWGIFQSYHLSAPLSNYHPLFLSPSVLHPL